MAVKIKSPAGESQPNRENTSRDFLIIFHVSFLKGIDSTSRRAYAADFSSKSALKNTKQKIPHPFTNITTIKLKYLKASKNLKKWLYLSTSKHFPLNEKKKTTTTKKKKSRRDCRQMSTVKDFNLHDFFFNYYYYLKSTTQ